MSAFEALWGDLIDSLGSNYSRRISHFPDPLISFVYVFGNEDLWESELTPLFGLAPSSLVLFPDTNRTGGKWFVRVTVPSVEGFEAFSEKFRLFLPKGGDVPRYIRHSRFPPVSLFSSTVKVEGIVRKFASPRGHVYVKSLNVFRSRAFKLWNGNDPLRRKRRRVLRGGDVPPGSSSTDFPVHFLREVDGTVQIDSSSVQTVLVSSRTTTRVKTPNFHLLKKFQLPVNPYSLDLYKNNTRLGYQVVESVVGPPTKLSWVGPIENFVSSPAPDLVPSPEAYSKAFAKLLDNIDREPHNLAVDVLQFRQVTRMVASNLNKISRSVRALKRGNFSAASKALFGDRPARYRKGVVLQKGNRSSDAVANLWLELQYGWKPLLQDIKFLIDTIHLEFHPQVRVARGSGYVISSTETDILGPFNASFSGISPFRVGMRVVTRETRVRLGMRYTISDSDRAYLAQTGFLSPINAAWEILPWSFVVDWAIPIGPYLESLAAFEGLVFVDGFKSTLVREQSGILVNYDGSQGSGPQQILYRSKLGGNRHAVRFSRERLTSFPERPTLRFRNPLSLVRATNAVALLTQTFSRKR